MLWNTVRDLMGMLLWLTDVLVRSRWIARAVAIATVAVSIIIIIIVCIVVTSEQHRILFEVRCRWMVMRRRRRWCCCTVGCNRKTIASTSLNGSGCMGSRLDDRSPRIIWGEGRKSLSLGSDWRVEGKVVARFDGALVVGKPIESVAEIVAAVIVQANLAADGGEDDDGNFGIAQDGEFHCLFQETILPFSEGDLAVAFLRNALDTDLLATHCAQEL